MVCNRKLACIFFYIKPKLSNIAVFMVIFGEEALPYP